MHAAQNIPYPKTERFHFHESQRLPTEMEADALYRFDLLAPQGVFNKLVRMRTKEIIAFPSKEYLQGLCKISSHNTLNRYLDELEKAGLIRIIAKRYRDKKGRRRTKWTYTFPLAKDAGTVEFHDEKEQEISSPNPLPHAASPMSFIDRVELNRLKIIKENNSTALSFPQSPNLETMPESPSAVFLDEETQEETPEISDEVPFDCQESLPVLSTEEIPEEESQKQETEPLVLIEDREKPENEIREELAQCVEDFQQKSPSSLAKTLKDDVVCLKKEFGIRNTFTAVKCLLDTEVLVLNPGGWLRSYLAHPSWLKRFMEKADQRVLAEERRVKAVIRKQQITEKQDREEERLFEERRRIEEVLRSLPVEEMLKLEKEAKKSLSQNRGVQHGLFLKAQIRNLVEEKYLGRTDLKI